MNYKLVINTLGRVLLIFAALMLLPLIAGLCYGENILHFIISIAITGGVGGLMLIPRSERRDIFAREGFVLVGLVWIAMGLFGALPFVISGEIPSYIDAVFETVSGLTTTGASIVTDVEGMSRGCMFWRCFTHWIGGMGILVFIMAIMPMDNQHSMHIMRAEVPGPTVGKLVPRLRDTAMILYIIYTGLTVLETVFLLLGGMSFYEALLHAFSSAGTGGFSTRADGIAAFNSPYIEVVITVFLILFGTNFNLYYLIFIRRWKDALRSEEYHCYLIIILTAAMAICAGTYSIYGSGTFRHAVLIVINTMSTAGFTYADYTLWPLYTQLILVLLMFCGACAGSTGGGLKLSRVMLLVKSVIVDVNQSLHPRSVKQVRIEGKRIEPSAVRTLYSFFTLYMLILLSGALLVSFDGFDFTTSFTASLACISSIGPGLGVIGPVGSYAPFSDFSKIILTVIMLFGRLEFYPLLILISPATWQKNRIK